MAVNLEHVEKALAEMDHSKLLSLRVDWMGGGSAGSGTPCVLDPERCGEGEAAGQLAAMIAVRYLGDAGAAGVVILKEVEIIQPRNVAWVRNPR